LKSSTNHINGKMHCSNGIFKSLENVQESTDHKKNIINGFFEAEFRDQLKNIIVIFF
jgi:hypothetical protein